jgi:hypothetical protein
MDSKMRERIQNALTQNWKEALIVLLASIANGMLTFWNVLDELGGKDNGFFFRIYETFFHTAQPEVIIGEGADPVGSFWIVSKVSEMLTGQSPTKLQDIYAPFGYDIALHEGYAWADTLFGIPWEILIGAPGFYNIHVFQTLCLSFIGMYLIFRVVGLHGVFSLILAHLSIFHSFGIDEVAYGRPTQMHWIWMTFTTIGVLKILYGGLNRTAFWKWSLFTGLSMGMSCLVYWFGAVAVGFSLVIVFILELFRSAKWTDQLMFGMIAAVTSLVVTLGVTWRVSKSILSGQGSEAYNHMMQSTENSIHFLGISLQHKGIHTVESLTDIGWLLNWTGIPVIPIIVWLTLIGTGKSWIKFWPWHIATFLALSIPMDRAIQVMNITIPTTYSWLRAIFPPLVRCYWSNRMMIAPTMLLMISSALVLHQWLSVQDKSIQKRVVGLFGIIAFLNLSYLPAKGDMFTTTFAIQHPLKKYKGGFIDVPLRASNEEYVQQLWHRQPILGGPAYGNLQSSAHKRYVVRNQFLQELESIHQSCSPFNTTIRKKDVLQLYKDDFRWIILHLDYLRCPISDFEHYVKQDAKEFETFRIAVLPLPSIRELQ